ncbi:hypothetical protein [Rudaea sp.]|uniref:hypothetical protein n=1 Tax=Rudaea sp. TaxID=2136325 RepID=UPI00321F7743
MAAADDAALVYKYTSDRNAAFGETDLGFFYRCLQKDIHACLRDRQGESRCKTAAQGLQSPASATASRHAQCRMQSGRNGIGTRMAEQKVIDGTRRWHPVAIGALMLAHIVCAVLASNASSDTNRDIFFAQQIASGSLFALTGPAINGVLHLGPLWYYLLAPVFLILPNAAAISGFICAVGALQYPLAYRLARRYASAREGILFVFALALPSFMDVQLGWLTHTVAIVPSLMLGVFAAAHYRERPSAARALWVGLALTFMLCAHPTLALLGGLLALWGGAKTPTWAARFGHALIVLVPIVLSLLPMLFDQWRHGFADASTAAVYIDSDWSVPSLAKAVVLIGAVLENGPKYVSRFWLELSPSAMRPLIAVYALIVSAAVAGLIVRVLRDKTRRGLIGLLVALALAQAMFVCVVRGIQPPWMVFALWSILAALIALGLEWICGTGRTARALVAASLAVTSIWSVAVWVHFASAPQKLVDIKPSSGKRGSYDVRDYEKAKQEIPMPRLPYRQYLSIAKPLCAPVNLYGHYAHFVDITYAVGAMQRCGGGG